MPHNPYYRGPVSDHFDGLRFFNPGQASTDRSAAEIWRWKRSERPAPWPASVPITPAAPRMREDGLVITMIGHVTLLIQVAGRNILTDPVWSDRASPVSFAGPKRVTAPGIRFEDLPPIDTVLISHNHYDHLDIASLRRLQADHAPVMVMPLGNDAIVARAVPNARIRVGDWHDRIMLGDDAAVTLTPATHWSSRGLRDRRMALWAGFWIDVAGRSIWFAGDTGYGDGAVFRDMAVRHGSPDVALIPIGAYAPRWFMAAQHVDPAGAVQIFRDIGGRRALGIHWGTFQLTDEPREEPRDELADALALAEIDAERFVAAEPGGVYRF